MANHLAALLLLAWTSMGDASLGEYLTFMKGLTANTVDYKGICKSVGKDYGGYSWKTGGGATTFDVTCGGEQVEIVCKGAPEFSKCTSSNAVGQAASGCVCASAHPTCKSNGWCYEGSKWATSHCPGSCTASAQTRCECPSSYPTCKSNKYCYHSTSWTSQCGGKCTQHAPEKPAEQPKPPASCECPSSYPFCYGSNQWCYQSSTSNSYTQTCAGTCTAHAASAPSPPPTHGGGGSQVAVTGSCGVEGFTQAEAQEMLDLHNKFRCAVGTPPILWNAALQCQAQKTQNSIGRFSHSSSYDLDISSGENLATGTKPSQAAWMWFTEYTQSSVRGHFTAMVWKRATHIGCGIQRSGNGVIRCQYAASPPNFGGASDFKRNVPEFKGETSKLQKCGLTVEEVKKHVRQFRDWGILHPEYSLSASLGLFEESEEEQAWIRPVSKTSVSLVAMAALVFMVIGVVGMRCRRSGELSSDSYTRMTRQVIAEPDEADNENNPALSEEEAREIESAVE